MSTPNKTTKELIEEASNKIWNGGSKLTHNQIDDILTTLHNTLLTELADRVERRKKNTIISLREVSEIGVIAKITIPYDQENAFQLGKKITLTDIAADLRANIIEP